MTPQERITRLKRRQARETFRARPEHALYVARRYARFIDHVAALRSSRVPEVAYHPRLVRHIPCKIVRGREWSNLFEPSEMMTL